MGEKFDFAGWATKNDILCADGRTIRDGAFRENDGQTVPLVYQHQHNDPKNVLGHALLEYRPGEGMYCYASCNDSENGQLVKGAVAHGDLNSFSIYANNLTQHGGDVVHGRIREVSVVLAPANDGAVIEYPILVHSGETVYDEAIIYAAPMGLDLSHSAEDHTESETDTELAHADEEPKPEDELVHAEEEKEEADSVADEKKEVETEEADPEKLAEIFSKLTDEQQKAAFFMFMLADAEAKDVKHDAISDEETVEETAVSDDPESVEHSAMAIDNTDEGETTMTHNIFDQEAQSKTLSHADQATILDNARRQKVGSLREMIADSYGEDSLMHAVDTTGMEVATGEQTYGFNDASMFFPDYRALTVPPEWIQRDQNWVKVVMSGVKHSMFSRIKSMYANITEDEARAKGYIKGHQKKNEVFSTLKRVTDPQTIYKHQAMDRDDIVDITDFDVVAWLKSEMRDMLDEEIARAILIGDGREESDDDKIHENHIHPIANDVPLFNTKVAVATDNGATDAEKAKAAINDIIRARKYYKGSGNPTFFTTEDWLTEMLLLEDDIGHKLYTSTAELATALRVKEIVTVEPMESTTISYGSGNDAKNLPLIGVIVNLNDYNVGADKGGAVNMFDDFDIDYNQYKYLIETRVSGALVKPYSALTILDNEASA